MTTKPPLPTQRPSRQATLRPDGARTLVARRLTPALYAAALLGSACVWPSPERQLLLDFFHACRVYDVTVLERLSAVPCNPKTDGVVHRFETRLLGGLALESRLRVGQRLPQAPVDGAGGSPAARRAYANVSRNVVVAA